MLTCRLQTVYHRNFNQHNEMHRTAPCRLCNLCNAATLCSQYLCYPGIGPDWKLSSGGAKTQNGISHSIPFCTPTTQVYPSLSFRIPLWCEHIKVQLSSHWDRCAHKKYAVLSCFLMYLMNHAICETTETAPILRHSTKIRYKSSQLYPNLAIIAAFGDIMATCPVHFW